MTPQRAQELEAELRRLAAMWIDNVHPCLEPADYARFSGKAAAFELAADLVRDAAEEG